jgi:copper(I)-binding protein
MKHGILPALLVVLAAPVGVAETAVSLRDAVIRAMPPGQPNSAAYLVVANGGSAPAVLVGGSSDVAQRVELHTTREVDGLMRMEPVEAVSIAPGEQLELAPGGLHLMLLGLHRPLVPGEPASLCLQFRAGETVCTSAEIRRPGAEQTHHDHHEHH